MKYGSRLMAGVALCLVWANAQSAEAQGARTHDGFYMQVTTGLGFVTTSADEQGVDQSISGLSLDTGFMIGGSPMAGLAIGGGLFVDYLPSPGFEVNGMDYAGGDVSQFLLGIGPFVDFYPNPAEGLHFQAFVGWGGLETSYEGNVGGSDPTGLVLSVGGGYDFFVSDNWSVGGLARIAYAPLSMNDVGFTSIAPALLANFTYH